MWIGGGALDGTGREYPLSIHWDGRSWTSVAVAPPDETRAAYRIRHILPISRSLAWAFAIAGPNGFPQTLLRWTGGSSWQEIPLPSGFSNANAPITDDGQGGVWLGGDNPGAASYAHFRNGVWTVVYGPSRDPQDGVSVRGLSRAPGTRTVLATGEIIHRDPGTPSGHGRKPFVERLH
ncbi:hypothetical protein [Actinomadura terrae]|uniref:hypothetical protein n=1 Tax=Actinomadura terrae TaxID=604353 RepID=UPI001FA79352|nr:hypothetical protein [Actinomadura terrae]